MSIIIVVWRVLSILFFSKLNSRSYFLQNTTTEIAAVSSFISTFFESHK